MVKIIVFVSEKIVQAKFAKLSINMKKCGILFKLSHRINNSDLKELKLNPEWQIKILEENFCFNKNSTCEVFQMKNSSGLSKASSNLLKIDGKYQIPTQCDLKNGTDFTIKFRGEKSTVYDGTGRILDRPDSVAHYENKTFGPLQTNEVKENKATLTAVTKELTKVKSETPTCVKSSEPSKHNESDFLIEGEKIVSFVCGPSHPGIQTANISDSQKLNVKTDVEPDRPENTVPKSQVSSQTGSTTFNKTVKNDATNKCDLVWSQPEGSNKLLWLPAFTQQNCNSPSLKKSQVCNEVITRSSNNQGTISHQNIETTLFREMALRSCYTMEHILSGTKTGPPSVQKEVRQVRESIFSAISTKESSNSTVADNILSVLDIFKSWVKLSSYLENKEFKVYLEMNGLDETVIDEFLKWQSTSRVFVDKFVQMLNNVVPVQSGVSDPAVLRKGFCFSTPPMLLKDNNEFVSPQAQHNFSLKFSPCVKSGYDSSKHLKQNRFSPDEVQQTDLRSKIPLCPVVSKQCPPNNTMNMHHGNTLLGNRSSEVTLSHFNLTIPDKISCKLQDETSFRINNLSPCPLTSSRLTTNIGDITSRIPTINGVSSFYSDSNLCSPGPVKGMFKVPAITFTNTPHEVLNTAKCLVAPHKYNSLPSGGLSSNQLLITANQMSTKLSPSQYVDSDANENYVEVQSNYMKPGNYNPPLKPAICQTVVNNNFPIEDPPVVGIRVVYGTNPPSKSSVVNSSLMKKDHTENDALVRSSQDCWQAASSSAEMFRQHLPMSNSTEMPNLNLSDTVSMKTHFLLGDETSQDSSSNESKFGSENEEISTKKDSTSELGLAVVETQLKKSSWLTKSFAKEINANRFHGSGFNNLESDNFNLFSSNSKAVISSFEDESIRLDTSTNKSSTSPFSSGRDSFDSGVTKSDKPLEPTHILQNPVLQCDLNGKNNIFQKQRKQCKNYSNDDYLTPFDRNPVFSLRKSKTLPKISITNEITLKLENILNCIWNTKVLSLVEEAAITDMVSWFLFGI